MLIQLLLMLMLSNMLEISSFILPIYKNKHHMKLFQGFGAGSSSKSSKSTSSKTEATKASKKNDKKVPLDEKIMVINNKGVKMKRKGPSTVEKHCPTFNNEFPNIR